MRLTDFVLAAAVGAFAYHVYAKVSLLEQMVTGGNVVHIGGPVLDIAGSEEDPEEGCVKFGFS